MAQLSIDDYGIIGNDTSLALVNRLGGIDWCCLPFVDSPSHFASILDQAAGGKFQICPQGDVRSEQRYLQRSLVLETLFETPYGRAILTDWMPLGSSDPVIYRKIDVIEGKIAWLLTCDPRFDYGESPTEVEFRSAMEQEGSPAPKIWNRKHLLFRGPMPGQIAQLFSTVDLEHSTFRSSGREIAEARFSLVAGESAFFAWAWGRRVGSPAVRDGDVGALRETVATWRRLAHHCNDVGGAETAGCLFAGPWHDAVAKTALFLRQLIAPYSGAVVESATTSLHATGGDYRYVWIRDCALTLQALSALGMKTEAKNHFAWLSEIVIRDGVELLQPIYTLDGGKVPPERELKNLKGFQGAGSVRIGNDESSQFHLDIYGHVLLAADFYLREWGTLPEGLWPRLEEIADFVCGAWRRPDHGPWDNREKAEHYVASKALCWCALDRACAIARKLESPVGSRWSEEMAILHRTICAQGFDPGLNSFVRSFGDTEIETSALLLPLIGFLPPDDPRISGTVDALMSRLSEGVLLRRSLSDPPHLLHLQSSFLLVAVLALSGQIDDASDRLGELCSFASQLGFFGEQVDSDAPTGSGETFGNFPNASAHLSLINAALYIGAARGRSLPIRHLIGMPGMPGPRRREPTRKIA